MSTPVEPIVTCLPRKHSEAFCTECHLAFGLVEDSPIRTVCAECFEKLGQPALCCDQCKQAIPPGEKCHLEWVLLCRSCTKTEGKRNERTYKCDTTAWSR